MSSTSEGENDEISERFLISILSSLRFFPRDFPPHKCSLMTEKRLIIIHSSLAIQPIRFWNRKSSGKLKLVSYNMSYPRVDATWQILHTANTVIVSVTTTKNPIKDTHSTELLNQQSQALFFVSFYVCVLLKLHWGFHFLFCWKRGYTYSSLSCILSHHLLISCLYWTFSLGFSKSFFFIRHKDWVSV